MANDASRTYPSELPVLALRQTVLFPLTLQPLAINRPMSIDAVNRALAGDRLLFLTLQTGDSETPGPRDLRQTGTVGVIRQMARGGRGIQVIVEGIERAFAETISLTEQAMTANIRR